MAQTEAIPQAWQRDLQQMQTNDPLGPVIRSLVMQESSGRPHVVGKAGEIGLMQIKPELAAQFGVRPADLFNPQVNLNLGARIFKSYVARYHGDVSKAVAAWNAGPAGVDKGRIPQSYVKSVLERAGGVFSKLIGEGTAYGEEPYTGPILSEKPKGDTPYSGPILSEKPKRIRMEIKKEIPLPFGARAAGYLPAAGQFAGEALGAGGAALTPGVGETGVGEYAGAVGGGALGAAGGAEMENAIRRKIYGLPPVSVGTEAAIGGGTSALGGLLPPVLRTRAAGAIGRTAQRAFGPAVEAAEALKGELERRVGTTASRAAGRISEVARPVIRAYRGTLNAALKILGNQYDAAVPLGMRNIPIGNTASQVLGGRAGQLLDMSGKPLRKAIQDEINAQPMTVRRAQEVLSFIKQWRRNLDPDAQRIAGAAIDQVQKALEADRDRVVGPAIAQRLKAIDAQYAQQLARFPMKAVRNVTTEAGAANAILKAKPNEMGRVLDVIKQMKAAGKLPVLRQAMATKIFADADAKGGLNEAERIASAQRAVQAVSRQVFDALYGQGARDSWLQLAKDFDTKQMELLKNPTEAKAIAAAVKDFLNSPTMGENFKHKLISHLWWIAPSLVVGGRYAGATGGEELAGAGVIAGGLFGIKMWESISHSRLAMHFMEQAATSKSSERTARMIFAAIDASMHAGIQEQTAETETEVNP
jgi:transglycosylase-like protein with SLT domain